MKTIIETIKNEWQQGQEVVLVTIVKREGSTPRGVGAQMLVGKCGLLCGTVGGGSVEKEALREALQLLQAKKSARKYFALNIQEPDSIGMVCGGSLNLHFLYMSRENAELVQAVEQLMERMESLQKGFLCLNTEEHRMWVAEEEISHDEVICAEEEASSDRSKCIGDKSRVVCLPIPIPTRVVIFGGGHVAQALVPVLASVSFRCVVVENREEFAKKDNFPMANEVRFGEYSNLEEAISLQPDDFIVIMTHGHVHDYTVLEQLLRKEYAYIGVMGSRKKIASVNQRLREAGIAEDKIASVHTPIGLKIGAVTPAEIAISVAAECIQIRALLRGDSGEKVCPSTV